MAFQGILGCVGVVAGGPRQPTGPLPGSLRPFKSEESQRGVRDPLGQSYPLYAVIPAPQPPPAMQEKGAIGAPND